MAFIDNSLIIENGSLLLGGIDQEFMGIHSTYSCARKGI